jgi:acetyltransferase-like isoleucine patch superfamily enzyme
LEVGKHTYDTKYIKTFWEQGSNLKIGAFCSIAEGCKIFLGGNHQTTWTTTFPFDAKFGIGSNSVATKGDVIIGNDVWIGHNVTIMSGVTIGDGVVIAANSHVIKNVRPYTLIGGNPAEHIKNRFSPAIIEKLLILKWWEFDDNIIKEMSGTLCAPPTAESIQELINKYKN